MMNQEKFRGGYTIWNMMIWYGFLTKPENRGIQISSKGIKEVSPSCLIKKRKSEKYGAR